MVTAVRKGRMQDITDEFITALRGLEETGAIEPLAALFSQAAEISNPLVEHRKDEEHAVEKFWHDYRRAFQQIHSVFRTVVKADRVSFIEWTSDGATTYGPFRYGGVTVIEHDSRKITAFRCYFDPEQISSGDPDRRRLWAPENADSVQSEAAEPRKEGGYQ